MRAGESEGEKLTYHLFQTCILLIGYPIQPRFNHSSYPGPGYEEWLKSVRRVFELRIPPLQTGFYCSNSLVSSNFGRLKNQTTVRETALRTIHMEAEAIL